MHGNRKMRRDIKKTGLCLAMAGLIAVWPLAAHAQTQWYDDSDIVRADISYEDMEYVGYDPAYAYTLIEEMRSLSQEPGNEERVIENYELLGRELD